MNFGKYLSRLSPVQWKNSLIVDIGRIGNIGEIIATYNNLYLLLRQIAILKFSLKSLILFTSFTVFITQRLTFLTNKLPIFTHTFEFDFNYLWLVKWQLKKKAKLIFSREGEKVPNFLSMTLLKYSVSNHPKLKVSIQKKITSNAVFTVLHRFELTMYTFRWETF